MSDKIIIYRLFNGGVCVCIAYGLIFMVIKDENTGWHNIYPMNEILSQADCEYCLPIGDIRHDTDEAIKEWIDSYLNYSDTKALEHVQRLVDDLPTISAESLEQIGDDRFMLIQALLNEIDDEAKELTRNDIKAIDWTNYNRLSGRINHMGDKESGKYEAVQGLTNALPDADLVDIGTLTNEEIMLIEAMLDEVDEAGKNNPYYLEGKQGSIEPATPGSFKNYIQIRLKINL